MGQQPPLAPHDPLQPQTFLQNTKIHRGCKLSAGRVARQHIHVYGGTLRLSNWLISPLHHQFKVSDVTTEGGQ